MAFKVGHFSMLTGCALHLAGHSVSSLPFWNAEKIKSHLDGVNSLVPSSRRLILIRVAEIGVNSRALGGHDSSNHKFF